MSSSPPVPFSITSHSQEIITILQTNPALFQTIVDWAAAESISRLSMEIINPPPPYTPLDNGFDPLEPLLPEHTMIVLPGVGAEGFGVVEMHFAPIEFTGDVAVTVSKVRQLARELVDLSSVVGWFYPARVLRDGPFATAFVPAGSRLFGTVKDIVAFVGRGGAWGSVGRILSDGGNTLAQFGEHRESMGQDSLILNAVRAALEAMKHEIDETMDGLERIGPGLEAAQGYVNKLSGTIKSCCPKIVSLTSDLASATLPDGQNVHCTPQQLHFAREWGTNIAKSWTGNNLDQLGVFNIGWTRIGANRISALATGSNMQDKLDNAIQAIDARLLQDPSAPAPTTNDDGDALDHLCVVLKHFMSEAEAWVRNVDEILVINRQYLADGSRENPLSRLFSGAFAPVEIRHPQIVPNDPSVFMPSAPIDVPLPPAVGQNIQPLLPF